MRGLRALSRLTAVLDRATCAVSVAIFVVILVTMVCQIAFRYVLNAPLVWTEELARYLYVWACWLGAAIALRRGNHIAVAFVAERLPPGPAWWVAVSGQALAVFFFVQLAVQGTRLAWRTHTVMAVTLPIPWSAIYAAAPVAALLMLLQTAETLARALSPPPAGRP